MADNSEFDFARHDGRPWQTLAAGSAPGESGVTILRARLNGEHRFSATPRRHLICFQQSQQARFACRLAGHSIRQEPQTGSIAICPAGADCEAEADRAVDSIIVAIQPAQLALAAAEQAAPDLRVLEQHWGVDRPLLGLARTLANEAGGGYVNGSLFWNQVAHAFIEGVVARHTSVTPQRARGVLGKEVLKRLRDYVVAHLDEPIDVATLASLAGRSPFHFSRVFVRSVGLSPYRYVVHLRLQRAIELVREGRLGLAEIAAATGFADQSHLSRWIRRVHGVTPSQLALPGRLNSRNVQESPATPS